MAVNYVQSGYVGVGYVNSGIWIDWITKVIFVPKAETELIQSVPSEVRRLDLNVFRLALKSLEDDPSGMAYQDTHRHNPSVVLSGVTYARIVEIINGYTVTFEPSENPYSVVCIGANHNLADVKNTNNVSLVVGNSAGLIEVSTPALGPTASEIAAAILASLQGTAIPVDVQKIKGQNIAGVGSENDPWGPAP
jgi:hypothetical protein